MSEVHRSGHLHGCHSTSASGILHRAREFETGDEHTTLATPKVIGLSDAQAHINNAIDDGMNAYLLETLTCERYDSQSDGVRRQVCTKSPPSDGIEEDVALGANLQGKRERRRSACG